MHRTSSLALLVALALPRLALAGEAALATLPEDDPEHVGEAEDPLSTAEWANAGVAGLCLAACEALPLINCGIVVSECGGASTLSVGSLVIPCWLAVTASCGVAGKSFAGCYRSCIYEPANTNAADVGSVYLKKPAAKPPDPPVYDPDPGSEEWEDD